MMVLARRNEMLLLIMKGHGDIYSIASAIIFPRDNRGPRLFVPSYSPHADLFFFLDWDHLLCMGRVYVGMAKKLSGLIKLHHNSILTVMIGLENSSLDIVDARAGAYPPPKYP